MDISEIRKEIDGIDKKMSALFLQRMEAAKKVGEYKKEHNVSIRNKLREREILSKLTEGLDDEMAGYMKMLYTTMFDLSSSYQSRHMQRKFELGAQISKALAETPKLMPKKASVACQGIEGAYSQQACDKLFALPSILYFTTFQGVFQAVEQNMCQYGILPIENSLHGSVTAVYDLMKKYRFHIAKSIRLKIDHYLLAKPDAKIADIKEIYSHEQAIGQCSEFIKTHPSIKINILENTAAAAKFVAASERSDIAAISSKNCADLYGLSPIGEHIANSDNNYTRFICISKNLEIYPGSNKLSLMFTVPHEPGSLYGLISKFSALGINLTKLESRPIPGRDFEFMFYFDLDASVYSDDVLSLLSELESGPEQFTFLGAYNEL